MKLNLKYTAMPVNTIYTMKCTIAQIQDIVLNNPNKKIIDKGKEINRRLMMHLHGIDVESFLKRDDYFESAELFNVRKKNTVSNKDTMQRILQEENLIFAARGGSQHFTLNPSDVEDMGNILSDVRYKLSLRDWIQAFGLPAYRADPMGVFFMEIEQLLNVEGVVMNTPKCYPTYKSIQCVFDYLPNGRSLEYVCFQLFNSELAEYGIKDSTVAAPKPTDPPNSPSKSPYFRFVDDEKDIIVKQDNNRVFIVDSAPIVSNEQFGKLPAFIISDIIQFNDPECFASPIQFLTELADTYLYDRSIRDLQKKYHGFAKAVEPLLKCPTCTGTGQSKGSACPDCTIPGQSKGIGYKLKTKISDVSKFPLDILEKAPSFDFNKIFGYVTPNIESWDKQDLNLQASEQLLYFTYWGASQSTITGGVSVKDGKSNVNVDETATKTLTNLKPKYTRLNRTADWAQNTENALANMFAMFWFGKDNVSNISYSRNYILETAEELIQQYYDMRKGGASGSIMTEQMNRYLTCLYEDNPLQLAKFMKLFKVEPFPHRSYNDIDSDVNIMLEQKLCKLYFDDWSETLLDIYIIDTPAVKLKSDLLTYASQFKPTTTADSVVQPPLVDKSIIDTSPVNA